MKELSHHERRRLWLRLGLRLILWCLGLWATVRFGPFLLSLFAPFLLAFLVTAAISPAVRWLHQTLGLSRRILAMILLVLVFFILGAGMWWLTSAAVGQISSLSGSWEELAASLNSMVERINAAFSQGTARLPAAARQTLLALIDQLFLWLETAVPRGLSAFLDRAADWAKALPSFAVATIAFVMASYFLIADYPRLRAAFADKLPQGPRYFLTLLRRAASAGFGGYFKAELFLSTGVFFILLGGFLLIRQPYFLLLAFALAVLDFLPVLGAGSAMVPWAAAELFLGDFRHGVGLAVVWGMVALFRRLAEPKALGDQTGLSPLLSLMAVYIGMRLGGVLGMVFGPMLCLMLRSLIRSGVMDNTMADLHLAFYDLSNLLGSGGE